MRPRGVAMEGAARFVGGLQARAAQCSTSFKIKMLTITQLYPTAYHALGITSGFQLACTLTVLCQNAAVVCCSTASALHACMDGCLRGIESHIFTSWASVQGQVDRCGPEPRRPGGVLQRRADQD